MKRLGCVSIVVLLVLGACSSDSNKSTATTTAAATATTTSATTDGGAATTAGAATGSTTAGTVGAASQQAPPSGDPCAIVTTDEIAAAFGGTVAPGVVNPDNGGCDYDISGTTKTGDVGIFAQISVEYGQSDYIDAAEEKAVAPEVVEVPGVGDAAWYLALGHQLHASVNGSELLISGSLPGDEAAIQAEIVDFAKAVVAKIG